MIYCQSFHTTDLIRQKKREKGIELPALSLLYFTFRPAVYAMTVHITVLSDIPETLSSMIDIPYPLSYPAYLPFGATVSVEILHVSESRTSRYVALVDGQYQACRVSFYAQSPGRPVDDTIRSANCPCPPIISSMNITLPKPDLPKDRADRPIP